MKTKSTPAASATPPATAPAHDYATSKIVEPRLHNPSGRTIGREQPGANGELHLFSATGLYIATVPAASTSS